MQPLTSDESKINRLMKEALVEALQEQKGVFHDLIVDAIEDIAFDQCDPARSGYRISKQKRDFRHT
ncbi:MAG: hypothetical protein PVI60_13820 [Desulfobacteraceae bacterium]|jgi:hypothetical protein